MFVGRVGALAVALGIGSALVEPKWIETGDFKAIEQRARQYVEIVNRPI